MHPWQGAGARATAEDFEAAGALIGCDDVAVVRAVWQVEAAGKPFRSDGTLERRFEPHRLAKAEGTWRTSLKIGKAERERRFMIAFARDPEDAMRATSWGGPQIMGENHIKAGFYTAREMVEAFADSEARQLHGFASFIRAVGLTSAFRARDWQTIAATYNGSGQVDEYASRMEAAYRKLTGRTSPTVLRLGARGEAVRRLQSALGVEVDGSFGKETELALKEFQPARGLRADGIAGARTWEALEHRRGALPLAQPATFDRGIQQVTRATAAVGGLTTALAGIREAIGPLDLPEVAINMIVGGGVLMCVTAVGLYAWQRVRGVAA